MPHRQNPKHLLYCTLTRKNINRLPAEVLAHVNGRRYQAALTRGDDGKEELPEELEEDLPEFLRDAHEGNDAIDDLEEEFRILAGDDDAVEEASCEQIFDGDNHEIDNDEGNEEGNEDVDNAPVEPVVKKRKNKKSKGKKGTR